MFTANGKSLNFCCQLPAVCTVSEIFAFSGNKRFLTILLLGLFRNYKKSYQNQTSLLPFAIVLNVILKFANDNCV